MRVAIHLFTGLFVLLAKPVFSQEPSGAPWETVDLSEFGLPALIDVPPEASIREPVGIFSLPGELSIWISDTTRNYRIRLGHDLAGCFDAPCDYKESLAQHASDSIVSSGEDTTGWSILYERIGEEGSRCRQVRVFQLVEGGISCDSTACAPATIADEILKICRSIRGRKP